MSNEKKAQGWPDWRDVDQYRHLLDLDRAGWAWEWLRRRGEYSDQIDVEKLDKDTSAEAHPVLILRECSGLAHKWGLCFR